MNLKDATAVLAKCAAYDNRQPAKATAAAWAEALDDMPLQDALGFVRDHYATSRDWIMPADINAAWKKLRWARLRAIPEARRPLPPNDVTPAEHLAFTRAVVEAIGAGADQVSAAAAGFAAIDRDTPSVEESRVREINFSRIGKKF